MTREVNELVGYVGFSQPIAHSSSHFNQKAYRVFIQLGIYSLQLNLYRIFAAVK